MGSIKQGRMTVTLYQFFASPPARTVLMTVELLKLKVNFVEVNTTKGEQYDPKFIKKNPTHTQPLLEDGDFVLPDSHAIITYLVSKYGEEHQYLYPKDLEIRATIDHKLFFDATLLFPKLRSIGVSVFVDKSPGPSKEQIEEFNETYGFLETYLENSQFLAGDDITLADISCVSSVSAMNFFVPIGDYPRVLAWLKRMEEEEWYEINVRGMKAYEEFFTKQMNENSKQK